MVSTNKCVNYLLDIAEENGELLQNQKLQKLMYLVYGWSLVINGEPLFEERVTYGKYGEFFEGLYRQFSILGLNDITLRMKDKGNVQLSDTDKALIEKIYDVYKRFNGLELSTLVRNGYGSAHNRCTREKFEHGDLIPDSYIKEYFQTLVKK